MVKNGIPFDVAWSLDEMTRFAWSVMFSEMEGRKFNWNSMKFEEPK